MTEACPTCKLPIMPNASAWHKQNGVVCGCGGSPRQPARQAGIVEAGATGRVGAKYGNQITSCGHGHDHDSKKEAERCRFLHMRQVGGEISCLEVEPKYEFRHNGVLIATMYPDFRYYDRALKRNIVEDVKCKATITRVYAMKKKMMVAFHGVTILEV